MATRSVSPGGALLRSSRMFSLPKPIPSPTADKSGSTHYNSATATLCHPTHQVITTMGSARKQGDWGLKRPLPLKSTTKATHAMLRVRAIDTIEHITDYTSATEHGMTLKKFQELNLPITMRGGGKETFNLPQKSVFEDQLDVTDIPPEKRAATMDTRWQFSGPWLAGMTQGEFKNWLMKEVRPKRSEFRAFLKEHIVSEINIKASAEAMDKGYDIPPPVRGSSVSEDELINYLKKLRNNPQQLYEMVGLFLDLAPLMPPQAMEAWINKDNPGMLHGREIRYPRNPYAANGPPKTHPSAGISYLRTSMFVENHPIYGPQKTHAPVQARVVRPRRQAMGLKAKLGVAGFIADVPGGETEENTKSTTSTGSTAGTWIDHRYDRLDPKIEGGAKAWVEPARAAIDSNGQVIIILKPGDPQAICVAQELLGNTEVLGVEQEDVGAQETAEEIREKYRAKEAPAMSGAQGYGLGEE